MSAPPPPANCQMSGKNIGDLLNAAGVTWGFFQGRLRPDAHQRQRHHGLRAQHDLGDHQRSTKADYIPHHQPFQYYASHRESDARASHVRGQDRQQGCRPTTSTTPRLLRRRERRQLPGGQLPEGARLSGWPRRLLRSARRADLRGEHHQLPAETAATGNHTAVVIAYDDSDGWYDHQMGPIVNQSATAADALTGTGVCGTGDQRALPGVNRGHRTRRAAAATVPACRCMVISPWAKHNFVDHTLTDQTSIIRFIEDNWLDGQRIGSGSFDAIAGSIDQHVRLQPRSNMPRHRILLNPIDRRAGRWLRLRPTVDSTIDVRLFARIVKSRTYCPILFTFCRDNREGMAPRYFFIPPQISSQCRSRSPLDHAQTVGAPEKQLPALDPTTLTPFVDPLPITAVGEALGRRPNPEIPAKPFPSIGSPCARSRGQVPSRSAAHAALVFWRNSFPGPTFETHSGQAMMVEWANELPAAPFSPHRPHPAWAPRKACPKCAASFICTADELRPTATAIRRLDVAGQTQTYFYPNRAGRRAALVSRPRHGDQPAQYLRGPAGPLHRSRRARGRS